ncbi:MAG: dTDP-4-dehydrorhamnose 3,5-epimerase [Anaerolineae bacterium]|nr:dTDP-4-dehydrorhamnose 3,5-epimerase [Anaerolineae bacterium]
MIFHELSLPGLILVEPAVFEDERGFFLERYNRQVFQSHGITVDFVQDNHSQSVKHVLRGLHFQTPPFAQDKLVWVTRGEVFDVVVDLRKQSATFGKWEGVELSETNRSMLFIPKGFAHGFVVLSERADFSYKVSSLYSPEHDYGLVWNDPDIGIEWPVEKPILSKKDQQLPFLQSLIDQNII